MNVYDVMPSSRRDCPFCATVPVDVSASCASRSQSGGHQPAACVGTRPPDRWQAWQLMLLTVSVWCACLPMACMHLALHAQYSAALASSHTHLDFLAQVHIAIVQGALGLRVIASASILKSSPARSRLYKRQCILHVPVSVR